MIVAHSFARPALLLILCSWSLSILVNIILHKPTQPTPSKAPAFDFPQALALPDLSMLASKPLAAHSFENGMVATGRSYHYQHNTQPIDIEIRYIYDAGVISTDRVFQTFTQIPVSALQPSNIKEQPNLGFYNLFVDRKTAYLSTCINPRGITTVTRSQFSNNRKLQSVGIPFNRLFPWLLGKQTLLDNRCFCTVLSTPIDPAEPNATMKKLEIVGVNWIRWWQLHFPAA